MSLTSAVLRDNLTAGLLGMPLSPEQEVLCERVALFRNKAHEIDDLWGPSRLCGRSAVNPGQTVRAEWV